MSNLLCYCCSSISFKECCSPFLLRSAIPTTAKELMRSRYSAFYLKNAMYIRDTMLDQARQNYDEKSILTSPIIWKGLEIKDVVKGSADDTVGWVSFTAYYLMSEYDQSLLSMNETSYFEKINNKWFYLNAEVLS